MAFMRSLHEKDFCLRTIQLSPSCRSPLPRVIRVWLLPHLQCSLRYPEEGTACLQGLLALRLMTCPYLSHILRPPRRRLHLVVHLSSSRSRRALLDNFLVNPLRSDLLSPSNCIRAEGTIRASRGDAPQPPSMGRLSELRALFLLGGQPLPSQPWVDLEDSGLVSWIVETRRVGFRIPFDRRPPLS